MGEDLKKEALHGSRLRQYNGRMAAFIRIFSALIPLYSIFFLLNIIGIYFDGHFFTTSFLGLFLFCILTLVFLLYPATQKSPRDHLPWYDLLLILVAAVPTLYQFYIAPQVANALKFGATPFEQVLFVVLLLVLFEAVRRTIGPAVLIAIVGFLLYARFSYLLPGLWGSPKFTLEAFTEYMYLFDSGIFGFVLAIAATIIILFVTFGAFLTTAGTAKFLMNSALAVAGGFRGGPAKVAIIASAMMGMVSGSATANVGTIGPITIPLMKRLGYEDYFAGGVESVASTGGIITPPVMGSIAFIMGQLTGLGYQAVCVGAILPAFLYYSCLYFQLDFEAAKLGLRGLPREEMPSLKEALRDGWHLLLPVILLIVLLVTRFDVLESALYSMLATIFVSWFRKESRLTFGKIVDSLASGARGVMTVTPVMATVGIILGSVTLSGLSTNLSGLVLALAGGNLWLLAFFTWLFMYVSGFGIGETVSYLVMVVVVVPAFIKLGVPMLAAHMFIFIVGTSMFIAPPHCPAVYVASAIAGSNMWRTGFQAMKLGVVAFIMPFLLIFDPIFIMVGSPASIVIGLITALIGAMFIASGIEGWLLRRTSWWERILSLLGGLGLFIPGRKIHLVGLLLIIPVLTQFSAWKREKRSSAPPVAEMLPG